MLLLLKAGSTDARFTRYDLAGRPLAEHLPASIRSARTVDVRVVDAGDALLDEIARAADDVLIVEGDVWLSPTAVTRLLARVAADRPTRVTSDGAVVAAYVPAAIVDRCGAADLLAGGAGENVDGRELDSQLPPVRVRTLLDLAALEQRILYARACAALAAGVRIRDPHQVSIRGELACGADVEIDIGVIIEGRVTLADGVRVGAHCILIDAAVGASSQIRPYSIVDHAVVGAHAFVGPYGRIRPDSVIGDAVQVGNFVEIKSAHVGSGSRINHLAFVGDAELGQNVTLGAGTITCNHDRVGIARTQIGDGAYIGSGTELVAPLSIGANATIGAGSTITEDAPADKLSLARARQVTVEGWEPPDRNRRP